MTASPPASYSQQPPRLTWVHKDGFKPGDTISLTFVVTIEDHAPVGPLVNMTYSLWAPVLTPDFITGEPITVNIGFRMFLPPVLRNWGFPMWRAQGLDTRTVYALAGCDNGRLFAGTDDGVYTSPDYGVSWERWSENLPDNLVRGVATQDCKTALATTWGSFVHKTEDGGTNWAPIGTDVADTERTYVLLISGTVVYVGTYDHGVYEAQLADGQWTRTLPISVSVLGLNQAPNGDIYASTWGRGIYRNWQEFTSASDPNVYAVATDADSEPAAAGTDTTLFDWDGQGWVETGIEEYRMRTPVLLSDGNIIYAGQEGNGVLVNADGAGWKPLNFGWEPPDQVRSLLIVKQGKQRWLYAGTTAGVWRFPLQE
jgi:hypothetical protein